MVIGLEPVDGLDPKSLLNEGEVYVSPEEVGPLALKVGLQLDKWIETHGPIDTIVAIKNGATSLAALLERVIPHGWLRYARMHRPKTLADGRTDVEAPLPVVDYLPENVFFKGKVVVILDEVYETGNSAKLLKKLAQDAGATCVIIVTLHWKPECSPPGEGPDIYGEKIDSRFRCYYWELWERMMKELIKRRREASAVAA